MIEKNFDISFIADLALREKNIQQNYRPIIGVHKWFARRPGTLFRGLLLAEFAERPLRETFYEANEFMGRRIADPFMGGGTPLLEANRLGFDVIGFDINPMSYWIVKQEIEHLDLEAYNNAADLLRFELEKEIGHLYRTRCRFCGSDNAHVKYFLWVKTIDCQRCQNSIDLFPGYLLSSDARHPQNVFVCPACGQLSETTDRNNPVKVHSFWTLLKLNLGGQAQGLQLFLAHLGQGFIAVALDDPVFIIRALKKEEFLAQLLQRGEVLHPKKVLLEGAHKTLRTAVALRGPDKSRGTGDS